VSVQGRAARMLDAKTFTADAEVVPGVNTIPVVATDGNGNRRTNNYQVTVPGGATRAFVYDGLGNLLDDGERTYQWDAKNRLIEAKRGADTWQWSYNAFDQRVSEKKNGVVTKRWVWAGGNQPAEERDAAGNVTRRFYPQGEQVGAVKYFYTKDHLGSIREVMGANGTVVSSSRYDAWGARTTVGAQDAASFGFTGHLEHKELGLVFTLYRAYDPATGRWLSRDPIGETGGINLYGYVSNNPVNLWDLLGLITIAFPGAGPTGLGWANHDFKEGVKNRHSDTQVFGRDQKSAAIDAIKKARENGDKCVNIYGYSRGGVAGQELAEMLNELGIQVDNLILIDPVTVTGNGGGLAVPGNVKNAESHYQQGPREGLTDFPGTPLNNPGPGRSNTQYPGPHASMPSQYFGR
jgi:RHS repeat-associated protein